MAAFFTILNPLFMDLKNYQTIATNAPIIGIVAIGLGTVILSGNVDLSVGSLAGLISVISAILLKNTQLSLTIIVIIGILIGIVIGAVNGFIVNYIGVNSIITTLGMWASLKGVSMILSSGTVYFNNQQFQQIGRGYFFKVIPNVFLFMIIILIIMYTVLRFTKFGRNIYLVGANTASARAVGINVKKTKFLTFLISSGFAAFAGIILASRFSGAAHDFGIGWEFRALTICIVGGISLSGGRGTMVGLFFALLILGSLSNGLTMINMPVNWRDFFEGGILLLAIIIDSMRVRRMSYGS
jgi:ribose/xylose/arabinose/galactoside ABC-type transport system permease subunit